MNNTHTPPDRTNNASSASADRNSNSSRFVSMLKRPIVFIPLLLLLLLLGLYLYKESQIKEVRRQAAQEKAAVLEKANQQIAANTTYLLQVLTKPFSWALRTAMLAGNQEQVDQYLFQFVQEEKFALVLVADANGTIISSTDQNFTGKAFSEHFDAKYLKSEAAEVDNTNPERVVVVTPIMGFNSRLGTLLAVYLPEQPMQPAQQE